MKDPRERHSVCKLERYELEDRYLRLLEELRSFKKLSNAQEDKIKRLATKLMRFGANPKNCLNINDDRDRVSALEAENSKLKDKICVLRNQLVNNKIFERSSSRGRRITSSHSTTSCVPATCRSENSRLKAPLGQCVNARPANEERDVQNYSLKIQEMEAEKKDMMSRIEELEMELASYTSGNRREKVAENVEYIRVWRQMKRQNEKLAAAQTANGILNEQIYRLKNLLDESNENKKQVSAELAAESRRLVQLEMSVAEYQESQVELRERDERIKDLTGEMAILQQHNRELLDLSSKFSTVERENVECQRKITEQLTEQQHLRDALAKEKASVAALQAANEQLLTKLHELQKSIDVMTIQLMAQKESHSKKDNDQSTSDERIPSSGELSKESACKKCCSQKNSQVRERGVQANEILVNETTQTDKPLDSAKFKENASVDKYDTSKGKLPRNGSSLSREGMLKLLEQVQISAPLESQNASRIRDAASVRVSRQVSNLETLLFGDSAF